MLHQLVQFSCTTVTTVCEMGICDKIRNDDAISIEYDVFTGCPAIYSSNISCIHENLERLWSNFTIWKYGHQPVYLAIYVEVGSTLSEHLS